MECAMNNLNNKQLLNWQAAKKMAPAKTEDYIFNEKNLINYELSAMRSLSLVHKKLRQIDKPFSGIQPKELSAHFADINLDQPLESIDEALDEVECLYLDHAIYFHHPRYVAHLNCPVAYPAVVAEQILSAINSSMDTWDQSAGATLIEQKLIDWTIERIGYDKQADGIFTSGGSQSNLMALLMARDNHVKKTQPTRLIRDQGLPADANKFRIITSALSHFSVQKSAAILGLGYDSVISVHCDENFKMDVSALKEIIKQCYQDDLQPIAIVATAGTTDFGSIDPVESLAEICQEHDIWLHVDAAYGGGLLATQHHRHLLNGIEQADSVTIDYHKSFLQPVSSSAFFLKDKQHFSHITHHAEYLNPLSQKNDGQPNLVDKSIQTTRRFDALKLWLTLRSMGADKVGQVFEQVMALAKQSYVLLNQEQHFEVLHAPELSALVFRYVPITPMSDDIISQANVYIRKEIFKRGQAVIAGTTFNDKRYLKFTLLNPATKLEHIRDIIGQIKFFGQCFFEEQEATAEHNATNAKELNHV